MVPALKIPDVLLQNCRILSDRDALLAYLPKGRTIVEVGVAVGYFSENLIRHCEPRQFIAIDLFNLHELPVFWGKPAQEWFSGKSHLEFYKEKFQSDIDAGTMILLEGDSSEQLKRLDNKSIDVFYVDGDHTYDGVCRDLSVIRDKVSEDGIIIMNDYIMRDDSGPYGVVQATNEFMISDNWEMVFLCLQTSMYCDVVLRKAGSPALIVDRAAQLEQENDRLRSDIDIIKNSTSWRITKPIRALGHLFR